MRAGRDRPEKFSGNVQAPSEASPKRGVFPTFAGIVREFYSTKCPKMDSGTLFLVLPVSLEVYYAKPYSN